ncbi:glutamate-cysteine ligase modifier subunit [Pseudomassariella vexata]|uniref:GCS light chain n=1 Tax=Pseudomassariella vexata TaxID=1141098 RepID=A0A1Y2DLB6_9PEZI|nr:glutamate-cysteine ligase modifier subunit [Pseudomassariella vexata]ORY59515.1 glutamate-cysteine ligase modifier subunit [Pseudomassariella vexata]
MTRIVLSTGNIISGGPSIIRKPGTYRSNLEFTNSLRSNFLAAQQDYAAELQNGNGNGNGVSGYHDQYAQPNGSRPATEVWTEMDTATSTLYVPRVDWSSGSLQEDREQYEITLKLFFLPTAPANERAAYIKTALQLVTKELGVRSVDLLIASFPGVSFEGDCEWEADKLNANMGNDEEELTTWRELEALQSEGKIRKLGIAEFGTEKLARFIKQVKTRPAVNQINVKNCCNVPPPLTKLAKEERIELLTHGDCTDILPSGTLRELLGQGLQGAGVLADGESTGGGLRGNLIPEWVVKYTAFVKDRGVIENKGYFAGAELVEH